MSTQSPKRIQGTVPEVRALLCTDFKQMLIPYISTWLIPYFLLIAGYMYLSNMVLNYDRNFLFLFGVVSMFLVGFFHHTHFFIAESIENGDRTSLKVFTHVIKNIKLIRPINFNRNFWTTVIISFINIALNIKETKSNYINEILIYGLIVLFWKGLYVLPFIQLFQWIQTRITNGDKAMAVELEKEAIIANKELLVDLITIKKFYVTLTCIFFPLLAILIEPFAVLMGYVFYKHVFDDGLKMKQRVTVTNRGIALKPKIAFSTN